MKKISKLAYSIAFTAFFLTSCGAGDPVIPVVQGVEGGNLKFSITNNITHEISNAEIISDTSGASIYKGKFYCPVGKTCILSASSDNTESYKILLSNSDNELVGAWTSENPPSSFNKVNASLENLGAYLISHHSNYTGSDNHSTLIRIHDNLTQANWVQQLNVFKEFGTIHNDFFASTGQQKLNEFHDFAIAATKNRSLTTVNTLQNPVEPSPSYLEHTCDTGGPARSIKDLATFVSAVNTAVPIPGFGIVATGVSKLLGAACDDTNAQFDTIMSQLSDISNQLNALQMGQAATQNMISQLTDLTARNQINTSDGAITTALNQVINDINSYNAVLNSVSPAAANLDDFFQKTGGLDASSLNPSSPKFAKQNNAILLLQSLKSQKDHLDALSLIDNYNNLYANLNQVCSYSNVNQAIGDVFQTRRMCNAIITRLIARVAGYASVASSMLFDELKVYEKYKFSVSVGLNPFGNNLTEDQNTVNGIKSSILQTVAAKIPKPYALTDGFPPSLLASMSQAGVSCGTVINGVGVPNIVEWYPSTNAKENPYGPYVVTHCYSGHDFKFTKFYYTNISSVKNIMGILIDSNRFAAGFEGSTSNVAFIDWYSNNGYYKDKLVLPGQFLFDVYYTGSDLSSDFCNGKTFCPPGNQSIGYPNSDGYLFAQSGANELSFKTKDTNICATRVPISTASFSSSFSVMQNCTPSGNLQSRDSLLTFTDTTPDSLGRRFTYIFNLYIQVGPVVPGLSNAFHTQQYLANSYYLRCVTTDCSYSSNLGSFGLSGIRFANGKIAGPTASFVTQQSANPFSVTTSDSQQTATLSIK